MPPGQDGPDGKEADALVDELQATKGAARVGTNKSKTDKRTNLETSKLGIVSPGRASPELDALRGATRAIEYYGKVSVTGTKKSVGDSSEADVGSGELSGVSDDRAGGAEAGVDGVGPRMPPAETGASSRSSPWMTPTCTS